MSSAIEKIQTALDNIENKKFNVLFFVIDSKGAPTGSLAYIYETAKQLKDLGYSVKMLHAENDFVGVDSWLGEEYSSLPHFNIEKDSVAISPDDFLFIPEIYANVMSKTKELPCKRVAILQNFGYLTEVIPMGASWGDLKIRDCIATSESLKSRLNSVFPEVRVNVVHPSIPEYFKPEGEKKLIINVVSKNQSEVNAILKPFFWKFPQYSWVPFRNVANLPRKEFASALAEGFATLWCDTTTDFGYSALEAMACGSIVIGKIPENEVEWMVDSGDLGLKNNGIWFYNNLEAQDAIASAIQSFITESVPEDVYKEMKETVAEYTPERQSEEIKSVYEGLFAERKKELEIALSILKNKEKENDTKE